MEHCVTPTQPSPCHWLCLAPGRSDSTRQYAHTRVRTQFSPGCCAPRCHSRCVHHEWWESGVPCHTQIVPLCPLSPTMLGRQGCNLPLLDARLSLQPQADSSTFCACVFPSCGRRSPIGSLTVWCWTVMIMCDLIIPFGYSLFLWTILNCWW